MPLETGIWTPEEAQTGHDFSYRLAKWIGEYFPKDKPLIDIGCGPASYLRYLHDIGFTDLFGIEGTEQPFEFGRVHVMDIIGADVVLRRSAANGITGDNQPTGYDSVISLEVGEHIPEQSLNNFLDRIAGYCNPNAGLLISWAIPGQHGIGHLSCRHNIWVINELQKRGFTFLPEASLKARESIEERLNYFRNTLMVFKKNEIYPPSMFSTYFKSPKPAELIQSLLKPL